MNKSIVELSNFVCIVVATVIEKDGKYLMIQEAKEKVRGLWNFPSGKVDYGETLIEAATRESNEETGYDVTITNLCSVHYYTWEDKEGLTIKFNFWGKPITNFPTSSIQKDVLTAKWFTKDELQQLEKDHQLRSSHVSDLLHEVLHNKKNPVDVIRHWI